MANNRHLLNEAINALNSEPNAELIDMLIINRWSAQTLIHRTAAIWCRRVE